jgi:hypothetical protein
MLSMRSSRSLALAAMLSFAFFAPATAGKDAVVPPAEAAARIEALAAELQAQRTEANGRYYDGAAYLRQLFQKAAVYPRAMQYASSWGDNTVYLNWNGSEAFYRVHLEALRSSLALARNGRAVSTADLDYLAAGVRRWREEEELIDADLTRSAELYAQQARKLGERMAIDDKLGPLPEARARAAVEPQRQQLAAEAEALRQQASAAAKSAIERARQRLFSPLDATPRIAAAAPGVEPPCETVERKDIVDTGAAFDALEQGIKKELEAAGDG